MADKYEKEIDIIIKARGGKTEGEKASREMKDAIENEEITPRVRASIALDAIRQVNKALKELQAPSLDQFLKGGLPDLNISGQISAFEGGGLEQMISGSSLKGIQDTISKIEEAILNINDLEINPVMQDKMLDNMIRYREILMSVNEEQQKTSGEGGTKLTQFLDRYKYSLLLVGGALGTIVGMMRYSTTFGTALDVLGASVGYLADVILYPLLPSIMHLAEWIIGLADWFSGLPEPIRLAVTSLATVGAALYLFGGPIGFVINLLKKLILFLNEELVAGAFAGAAGVLRALGLITISLAASYGIWQALAKTGVLDSLDSWVSGIKEKYPEIFSAVRLLFSPFLFIGTTIVDLFTGQWDKIPEHIKGVLAQLKDDLATLAPVVLSPIFEVRKGILETMKSVQGALGFDTTGLDVSINQVNHAIDQLNKDRDEAIARTKERYTIDLNTEIKATDMDLLNGLTSEDQIKAYFARINKVAEEAGFGSDIDTIIKTYDDGIFDATRTISDGTKELNAYNKKLEEVTGNLYSVKTATDLLSGSTKTMQDTVSSSKSIGVDLLNEMRHDKLMHDYTTQSKYQYDSYRPGNERITQPGIDDLTNIAKNIQDTVQKQSDVVTGMDAISKHIGSNAFVQKTKHEEEISPLAGIGNISIDKILAGLGLTGLMGWLSGSLSGSAVPAAGQAALGSGTQKLLAPGMLILDHETLKNMFTLSERELEGLPEARGSIFDRSEYDKRSLPDFPAPVTGSQNSQTVENTTNNYNTTNNFQISSLDIRKIADEVARIWDQQQRGTRI